MELTAEDIISPFSKKFLGNGNENAPYHFLRYFPQVSSIWVEANLFDHCNFDFIVPFIRQENVLINVLQHRLPQNVRSNHHWINIFKFATFLKEYTNLPTCTQLWLEFDSINQRDDTPSVPGIFFNSYVDADFDQILTSIEIITGTKLCTKIEKNIRFVLQRMPKGNLFFDLGIFLSRDNNYIRINVWLSSQELHTVLSVTNLKISSTVRACLETLLANIEQLIGLDIDFYEDHVMVQGIEIKAKDNNWKVIIDILNDQLNIDEGLTREYLKWPSTIEKYYSKQLESLSLHRIEQGRLFPSSYFRRISHIKLLNNGRQAKIYLLEGYRW